MWTTPASGQGGSRYPDGFTDGHMLWVRSDILMLRPDLLSADAALLLGARVALALALMARTTGRALRQQEGGGGVGNQTVGARPRARGSQRVPAAPRELGPSLLAAFWEMPSI